MVTRTESASDTCARRSNGFEATNVPRAVHSFSITPDVDRPRVPTPRTLPRMRRVLTGPDFSAHHTDMNTCLSPPITTIITITNA